MAVIDEVSHPQAVFVNFEADDVGLRAMQSLVAGSMVIEGDKQPKLWRDRDWDIWVQHGAQSVWAPEHMHVLTFANLMPGSVRTQFGGSTLTYGGVNHSPTMQVVAGLPDEVARLVSDDLIPHLRAQKTRPVLYRSTGSTGSYGSKLAVHPQDEQLEMAPFVLDADGNVIAGAFRRYASDVEAWMWVLPHVPDRPELWLAAAIRDWHGRTPDRVPVGRPWQLREEWMTEDETSARTSLISLHSRRERWEQLYAARRHELEAQQLNAQVAAADGLRRLLTANDDELVDAVALALSGLGFHVTNEDDERVDVGRGKAHDLNVEDPDSAETRIIAEVKGFTKGARGALAQAQQHILRFATAHGGETPDRCWLILNHFREHDPDERPPLLQGADDDIAIFTENGGVLIDTRDLFRLFRQVERAGLSQAEARSLLRNGNGRLVLPQLDE